MASKTLIKQGEITKENILNWLLIFTYSHFKILAEIAGIKRQAMNLALAKLEKKGLVKSFKTDMPIRKVWGITWQGVCEIESIDQRAVFQPSKFNEITATHHFHIQQIKIMLKYELQIPRITRTPKSKQKVGKIPDGIYTTPSGSIVAVEVERRIKTKERYQQIWGDYVTDIRNEKYNKVQYFLTDKQAVGLKRIFDQTTKIIINSSMRFGKATVTFTPEMKSNFIFSDIREKMLK